MTGVEEISAALRAWYGAFNELGRQFGIHVGMHGNDATALVQITSAEDRGALLTQSQLSRRIGLSTAATSALVSRLEEAGHVERHRGRPDRRVVTLRATESVHEEVHGFFRQVGIELDRVAERYPAAVLADSTELVLAMTAVLDAHLERAIAERATSPRLTP